MLALRGKIVGGKRTWSSEALAATADRLRARLVAAGVGAHSRVAVAVADTALFMSAVAATRSLDAVAVLLSSRDAGATRDAERTCACLLDSEAAAVVVDKRHASALAQFSTNSTLLQVDEDGAVEVQQGSSDAGRTSHPAGAALLVYTSGTEGAAKGVLISATTLNYLLEVNRQVNAWTTEERLLSVLPLSHLSGFVNVAAALDVGATVVACPDFMWIGQVLDTCVQQRITVAPLVPYYLSVLVRQEKLKLLTDLRLIVLSTAPAIRRDAEVALAACPQLRMANAYGLTESLRSLVLPPEEVPHKLPSVGRPVRGVDVELRNGVAWVRGPNLMMQYWKRPEETAAVLQDDWFCTNDLMSLEADGTYRIVGRLKEVIQGGGEKISPEVLEEYIGSACPVADVVAFGVPRPTGFDEVVAVAVPRADATLTLEDVRAACAAHVHSAFLPSRLVLARTLPRGATGKLDRGAIRRTHA